ncbi:hypothetical protein B0A49_13553, partial [Cryomyces minteri]
MNAKLFPPPVGITTTTGLSPRMIAVTPSFWTPLNFAASPCNRLNCSSTSVVLNFFHRSTLASSASTSNGAA